MVDQKLFSENFFDSPKVASLTPTGLRKGEKMNEQLFFKDEVVNKTDIDGIFSTNSKLFTPSVTDFNKMISNISNNKPDISISLFEKLLPEYDRDEKR